MTHDVSVSGDNWTMPNGATAPGNVCPSPPVPMNGSTASLGLAAFWAKADPDRLDKDVPIRATARHDRLKADIEITRTEEGKRSDSAHAPKMPPSSLAS